MTNAQVTNRNSQTFGPYSHLLPWPMLLNVELGPHSEMLVGSATIQVADVEFGWNHVGLEERVADGGSIGRAPSPLWNTSAFPARKPTCSALCRLQKRYPT